MTCPSCGAQAEGRFCSSCGSPLEGALCAGCGSSLTPGAKFCHRCGTAVGSAPAAAARGPGSALPWAVAGIALLALIALIAGRNFSARPGSSLDAPSNALPVPGLDDRGTADAGGAPAGMRAPDISQMSPQERADRLFDRVMRLASEGKPDSVQVFAPMAIQAFQMIGQLDADQRYDLGRLGEIIGDGSLAAAQADTILQQQPTHLLGLLLGARAASVNGDAKAEADFERRFRQAEPSESKRNLPEYQRHRAEIADALARGRKS